jgi:hypothetical protein
MSSPASAASPIATKCWDARGNDLAIKLGGRRVEATEDDSLRHADHAGLAHGDIGRRLLRVAVNTSRYRRKGNAVQAMDNSKCQAVGVAFRQKFGLVGHAASPDRADGVDHMARHQPIALGNPGFTGRTTAEAAALGQQIRTGCTMDGAINATTTQQAFVGCVHDGVDVELSDVAFDDLDGRHRPYQ